MLEQGKRDELLRRIDEERMRASAIQQQYAKQEETRKHLENIYSKLVVEKVELILTTNSAQRSGV